MAFDSVDFGDGTQGGKNTALQGGAIYAAGADLTVSKTNFKMNEASETYGGAIFAESGAKVASSEGIFDSNTAKAAGGAIYLNNSELEDSGSKFSNNTALNGGALYIDETSSATIKDSSFSSNLAKGTDAKGGCYLQRRNAHFDS